MVRGRAASEKSGVCAYQLSRLRVVTREDQRCVESNTSDLGTPWGGQPSQEDAGLRHSSGYSIPAPPRKITRRAEELSYRMDCMERPGGIRHPTWDFPRCHLVTAEEKIRELCV